MSESPKLFTNKPKKAQLKQFQQQRHGAGTSLASMTSSTTVRSSPPPPPPKESFARRYRFMWPLLLAVNLSIAAYLYIRTKKKDIGEDAAVPSVPSAAASSTDTTASVIEKPPIHAPIMEPPRQRELIPENVQRELFKWILEEKRKVKPKGPEEKKRIDEEKALLKQFIRAKSIPNLQI